jgi:hypothetical protein
MARCLGGKALQRGRTELMPSEHTLDAPAINRPMIALPDDPRQFASGERMSHCQSHDLPLDILGKACVDGRFAAGMGESTPVQQAQYASPLKASHITPQSRTGQSRDVVVLGNGSFPFRDLPNRSVAHERVPMCLHITEEEVRLEHTSRILGDSLLLPH